MTSPFAECGEVDAVMGVPCQMRGPHDHHEHHADGVVFKWYTPKKSARR